MLDYLKKRMGELLLCLGSAWGLASHLCAGFALSDRWENDPPVLLVLHFAVLLVLYFIAYRRRTTVVGIVCGVAAALAAVLYIRTVQPFQNEEDRSLYIVILVVLCTDLAVFLLARSRCGTVILFLAGNILMAGSAFLQFPVKPACMVLFLLCSLLLFLHRFYIWSLLHAQAGKPEAGRQLAQNAVLCLLAAALALGTFACVIRPLEPPTQELKLITRLRSMRLTEVLGVYTTRTIYDEELESTQEPETEEESSAPGDENDELPPEQELQQPENDGQNTETIRPLNQRLQAIRMPAWGQIPLWKRILAICLVLIVLVLPFAIRLAWRQRWLRLTRMLPPEEGAARFYLYFLQCLRYTGLPHAGHTTLTEYAADTAAAFEPFAVGKATFSRLTEIYTAVLYGHMPVSKEEYRLFEDFYGVFRRNLRREIGLPRYLLHWFRI